MPRQAYQPRVSVVVPAYNGATTIAGCIEALLAQSYPSVLTELIFVDNGSTDRTRDVIAAYPVTLLTEKTQTSYAARNCGIVYSSGEIVALTDADCMPAVDWLADLVAALEDEAVGAAAGNIDDASPRSLCEEFTVRLRPFARPHREGLKTLLTANVALRRSTLDSVGLFDEHLPTGGDVDFGWRMQMRGFTLVDVPGARVFHRHRSRFRQIFAQYRRYGLSEILLGTLYAGRVEYLTPGRQTRRMLLQVRAMVTYCMGFVFRNGVSVVRGFDRRYTLWPLFLLFAESGNLLGKLEGMFSTRWYRQNPYFNPRIRRSD